jgi:DNA (cytosine-5)-methyltransferase 1
MVKKIKFIDLFAGAGGFSLGFNLSGHYTLSCAIEQDHWAADTLRENKENDSIIIEDDIRKYKTKKKITAACGNIYPDVIVGGPPCQGFSVAGPAIKDPKDPRNSLFQDFARWVSFLRPKVFVMENVKGILTRRNARKEKVADIIVKTFEELGYKVEIWKLNAVEHGVPQIRERVFFVGNIYEETIGQPKRTHSIVASNQNYVLNFEGNLLPAVTVGDAISDLSFLPAGSGKEMQDYVDSASTDYQRWARGNQKKLFNHVSMKHTARMIERFKLIRLGYSIKEIPAEYRAKKRNGNGELSKSHYNSNNRILEPTSPAYTIPAHFYSSFVHPYQDRNLTAREAARIQSFPDGYRFMGKRTVISHKLLERYGRHEDNYLSQYNQIGNAVPPLLAKAIAEHIYLFLKKHK